MAWKQKKTDSKDNGIHTYGLEHYLLVSNQYRKGGPLVKGFRRCGLVVRRKWVCFGVPSEASFGKNALLRWHFAKKR